MTRVPTRIGYGEGGGKLPLLAGLLNDLITGGHARLLQLSAAQAFATVHSITVPAHDGTGATTAIGWGSKLGLPDKLPTNTVLFANHDNAREGTAPTVAVNASDVALNTFALNTSLNGKAVAVAYIAVGS